MTEKTRSIDQLRICAAFAVVCLHVSASVVESHPNSRELRWWIGNFADAATRWCVPVFVMISGYLILPKASQGSLRSFYLRRASRLAIPLLFWSCFYLLWTVFREGKIDNPGLFTRLINGAPYYHLWFLYMICGLYLVSPFLSVFVVNAERSTLLAAIVIGFVMASVHANLGVIRGSSPPNIFTSWVPFVPYYLMGYYFAGMTIKINRLYALSITVVSILIVAAGVGLLLPWLGATAWNMMYGNLNPFVILSSLGIFTLFVNGVDNEPSRMSWLVSRIAPLTLGVYIIHLIWLQLLWPLGLSFPALPTILWIPVTSLTAFLASLITCAIVASVPGGRRLVA